MAVDNKYIQQQATAQGEFTNPKKVPDRILDVNRIPISKRDPYLSSPDKITYGQYFQGDSQYDEDLENLSRLDYGFTAQELRAEAQPGIDQIANGIAKGIITAGTTFVGNTAGLINGVFQSIYEGDFSKL